MSEDAKIISPLQVGDIVRVTTQPPFYSYGFSGSASTYQLINAQYQNYYQNYQTTITAGFNTYQSQPYASYSTGVAKQPAIGAHLVITGILKKKDSPIEATDLDSGEEYEVYEYQVVREEFMTGVKRRREVKAIVAEYLREQSLAAMDQAPEIAPRTEHEPLLLEAGV